MALAAAVARPADEDSGDLQLVARVRAGDDRAFELLYVRYQRPIAAYVRGMVRDPGRAEDITQEVFISALRRMRETDREIVFKPWVYEIAKNACIDAFRRSRHRNEVSFDADDALGAGDHHRLAGMGGTPDRAVDAKLELDNLRGAFGGLSELHHRILVLRELDGLSYRDIGERLGMSAPAVESTLFRARRRLGEEYDELVSGKRCLRVRAIVDAGGRSVGVRDGRRLHRHISHCQPCRRYARASGLVIEARPALRPVAAKIAALLPLPSILRRRGAPDSADQLFGSGGSATLAQWPANVAGGLDPGTVAGWSKAVIAAATVAVAGVGAGAAVTERQALHDFVSRAPALIGAGGAQQTRDSASSPGDEPRGPARLGATAGGADRRESRGASSSKLSAAHGATPEKSGHATRPATGDPQPVGSAAGGGGGASPLAPVHKALQGALQGGTGARHGSGPDTSGAVKGTVKGATGATGGALDKVGSTVGSVQHSAGEVVGSTAKPVTDLGGSVAPTLDNTVKALPLLGH
jgi:RNA polymerase sigma factor (sigma-70 family)